MMGGGLYGDLPPPSSSDDPKSGSGWSSAAAKLAPTTTLRKPAFTPPPSVLRSAHNKPKPNPNPNPSPIGISNSPPATTTSYGPALVGVTATVVEEYDPARPNDYEEYRREKKKRIREEELRKELERRQQEEEAREKEREERLRASSFGSMKEDSLSVSGEEAWRRRAAMSGGGVRDDVIGSDNDFGGKNGGGDDVDGFSIGRSETAGLGVGAGGQMTAAQRMMAKMGWKAGQGLGKQEQGITTPLMAKKTDRRAGVIVNASETKQQQQEKKVKSVNFNGPPTRVLLLRNMVGPGEVDDELEDEVGSECAKYGTVTRVLIFEITEPSFPANEAVRIFVQFERPEETTKALVDLDGRFFGGRVVRGSFYDEERFNRNELAPVAGEVPGF